MYAGKFAQVCQTTKDTLRHYDEIGLLKPASINENGYRVYSASQIIDFLTIASLQEAGCSLEEIRNFQRQHDPAMTLRLFNDKKGEIEAKAREIERKQQLIESAIASLQAQKEWQSDKLDSANNWRLVEEEKSYFLSTRIPLQSSNPEELFLKIAEHEKSFKEGSESSKKSLPNLYKVGKDAFLKGDYESDFSICSEISESTANLDKGEKRPAGLRFQSMHRFSFDKTNEPAFQEDNPLFSLLSDTEKLLRENELETCGDLLIKEIATHLNSESHEVQIMLDIPVAHKNR